MGSEPRTVKSFSSEIEAHLARTRLQVEGIDATVHRYSRYRAIASGGYVLKVSAVDFPRANAILGKLDAAPDMDEYVDSDDESYTRCPQCRSVNVDAAPFPVRTLLLSIALLGIPLLWLRRDWCCRKCGHAWTK